MITSNSSIITITGQQDTGCTIGDSHPIYSEYKLVWCDEFDGNSIDTNKWEIKNEGLYRTTHAYVQNGSLVFHATRNADGSGSRSGMVVGKYNFKYGIIEARINCADGNGNPGLSNQGWLVATGARQHEIDFVTVCSYTGTWKFRGGTITIPNVNKAAAVNFMYVAPECPRRPNGYRECWNSWIISTAPESVTGQWHIFRLIWTPTEAKGYIDNKLIYSAPSLKYVPKGTSHFNFALCHRPDNGGCGEFPLLPVPVTATFPSDMKIDYVRVYQK